MDLLRQVVLASPLAVALLALAELLRRPIGTWDRSPGVPHVRHGRDP